MKKIIIIVAFTIIISCVAPGGFQIVPQEERIVRQIHEVKLTKDEIFPKCLEWMAQTFVDSKEVVELKDKETGKIIGKGITNFMSGGIVSIPCRYTIVIDIKDYKYRTTYKNFIGLFGQYRNDPVPLKHKAYIDEVKTKLMSLDQDLFIYLTTAKKDDNW